MAPFAAFYAALADSHIHSLSGALARAKAHTQHHSARVKREREHAVLAAPAIKCALRQINLRVSAFLLAACSHARYFSIASLSRTTWAEEGCLAAIHHLCDAAPPINTLIRRNWPCFCQFALQIHPNCCARYETIM